MTKEQDPPEPIDVPLGDELSSPLGGEPLRPDAAFEYTNPAPEQLLKLEDTKRPEKLQPPPRVNTNRPVAPPMPPPRVNTNRPVPFSPPEIVPAPPPAPRKELADDGAD